MYFYKKKEPQAINEDKIIMNKNPFFKKKIGNEIKELDAYDILGIQQNSTENEIKKAYKDLSLVHHPDKGGDIELFSIINKAYRTALMVSKAVKPQSKIEHHELKKNSMFEIYLNSNFLRRKFKDLITILILSEIKESSKDNLIKFSLLILIK